MAIDNTPNVSPGFQTGTFAGTTAAQTITVGFQPSMVIFYNQTDGDTALVWHKSSLTNLLVVTTAAATQSSAITTTDHGFVLPASDAVVNENGKTYVYIAFR